MTHEKEAHPSQVSQVTESEGYVLPSPPSPVTDTLTNPYPPKTEKVLQPEQKTEGIDGSVGSDGSVAECNTPKDQARAMIESGKSPS